jgi:urease accessory protein
MLRRTPVPARPSYLPRLTALEQRDCPTARRNLSSQARLVRSCSPRDTQHGHVATPLTWAGGGSLLVGPDGCTGRFSRIFKGTMARAVVPAGTFGRAVLNRAFGIVSAGPAADAGIILVLGLLLAAQTRIPTALLCAIAFGLAMMRGAANAEDVAPEISQLLYAAGLACAGYAAITRTMASTLAFQSAEAGTSMAWRGIAIRAVGGWIAAIGIMMFGLALAS